jgi:hypothetical protein
MKHYYFRKQGNDVYMLMGVDNSDILELVCVVPLANFVELFGNIEIESFDKL